MDSKILFYILDDSIDFIKIINSILSKDYKNYKTFTQWRELVKECKETCPDLVIIDFHLDADATGIEVMNEVKKFCPETKFAFMSSLISIDDLTEINNAKCGYFINKTKNLFDELSRVIEMEENKLYHNSLKKVRVTGHLDKILKIIDNKDSHE